jgi:EmrB/QacA subfamily drug resistance transporter
MAQSATRPRHLAGDGKFVVLLTASLISSLIMLDSNIVAVSLPAIARSLGATFTEIEWVVSAYILTFAALLLAAGSFADRYGRKKSTLIGLVIFTLASALCGLATSAMMLNCSRAIQGVGSAFLLTSSTAVINQAFSGADRAKAYAFWGSCLGIAITLGPIVGGVMTDMFGWRSAFLVNLPVGTALFVTACFVLTESRDHDAKRLDIVGIATFSLGLFLLVWALIDGNNLGWAASAILFRLAGAFLLLIAFVIAELRRDRPMVDLSLFKQSKFLGAVFAMLGYASAAQVLIFFLPLFLQNVFGYSPTMAGLAMLPFALPMFVAPRIGASLAGRYAGRTLLTTALAATAFGNLLLTASALTGATYPVFIVGMLVAGSGAGLLNSETAKTLQGAVPVQRSGMASGISATTRFVGLLLGVALFGAVLSQGVMRSFIAASGGLGVEPDVAIAAAKRVASGDLSGVLSGISGHLQVQLHSAAVDAFSTGFASATAVAAAVAALTGALAYRLVRLPTHLPDESQDVESASRVTN